MDRNRGTHRLGHYLQVRLGVGHGEGKTELSILVLDEEVLGQRCLAVPSLQLLSPGRNSGQNGVVDDRRGHVEGLEVCQSLRLTAQAESHPNKGPKRVFKIPNPICVFFYTKTSKYYNNEKVILLRNTNEAMIALLCR